MAEDSGQTVVPALIDFILPAIPGIIGRLKSGINVLDIGCGQGRAINLLAKNFPDSRFTGYDISEQGIGIAKKSAKEMGFNNYMISMK